MRQVLVHYDLAAEQTFSRCPVCNTVLETMNREAARTQVPAFVSETHETFKHCPACRRVFWRGTHWQQMDRLFQAMQSNCARPAVEDASERNQHIGG